MEVEAYRAQRKQLLQELIEFLKAKNLDCGQALITLKDAQSHVERASLKSRF